MIACIEAGPINGQAMIKRWEVSVFCWHFLTVYKIETKTYVSNKINITYWISFSKNLSFGICVPFFRKD